MRAKQDALGERFDLWKHERRDWNQDRAGIVYSNDGVPAAVADIAFVGALSTTSGTWLWSWANGSLEPASVGRMAQVAGRHARRLGHGGRRTTALSTGH